MASEEEVLPVVLQLREAIQGSGLSLNELGRRAGVSEGQLSRFLRGDRTLTLPAAARVCRYFGLGLCPAEDRTGDGGGGRGHSSPPPGPRRRRVGRQGGAPDGDAD